MSEMIKLQGWSIESREIEIPAQDYRAAIAQDRLEYELDPYLSDMYGVTFVIETGIGRVITLWEQPPEIMERITPLLDTLSLRTIKDYVIQRERREAETPEESAEIVDGNLRRMGSAGLEAAAPEERWPLRGDDDGHWYLVPAELAGAFEAYVYEGAEWPEGVVTLGGAPSRVTFSMPEMDGEPL